MDSCFDKGDGEAVGYENVDEPVRLGAATLGNDDGLEVEDILTPSQVWVA